MYLDQSKIYIYIKSFKIGMDLFFYHNYLKIDTSKSKVLTHINQRLAYSGILVYFAILFTKMLTQIVSLSKIKRVSDDFFFINTAFKSIYECLKYLREKNIVNRNDLY